MNCVGTTRPWTDPVREQPYRMCYDEPPLQRIRSDPL